MHFGHLKYCKSMQCCNARNHSFVAFQGCLIPAESQDWHTFASGKWWLQVSLGDRSVAICESASLAIFKWS